ncbi:hypothetical protein [Clostridium arbusti]|uniref:hypothetical protein n=1 Tax=Clostridium arbusti TaxID=1137848 RepID=UPI0004744E4F|nr:hypothetical protein [Clostridium arbusti]
MKNIINETSMNYKSLMENSNIENNNFYKTISYSFSDNDYYFYPFFEDFSCKDINHSSQC